MITDPTKVTVYYKTAQPHTTRPGLSVLITPDGQGVVSYRGGGVFSVQPLNFDGGNEACKVSGSFATWSIGTTPETFAIVCVDGLV